MMRSMGISLPDVAWLEQYLPFHEQQALVTLCRDIMDGPAGGYVPTVRGGGKMHVRMACLGRHWNARTYRYEETRADHDGLPVAPLPAALAALAKRTARDAGFAFEPDICILNWYGPAGRMGLHQDKDESPASLGAGLPVVSISLGDTADGPARIRRRLRLRGNRASPLSWRVTHHAADSATRARRRGAIQSHLPAVLTRRRL